MHSRLPLFGLVAAVLGAPAAAFADGPAVSANVALTTKYKYRGQDQSDPAKAVLPALQGGFDLTVGGFYVGNWNSSVGFLGGTEMDVYGGYRGEVVGLSYDVGLLYYYYPGEISTANTTELYGSVGWGPVSLKYSHTASSRYFGLVEGKGTGYLELNAKYEVVKGLSLVGHLGTTRFTSDGKANGGVNFSDYKVGADYDLGNGYTAGAAYVGATKKDVYGDLNKGRAVLTLTKAM